ncbi:hypothetical protein CQW23_23920 [Capsicum baccatum]|uniref:NtEIG-E80 protein n=2 Tax=Capsicum TaxID=4071 RepID=A0A2G2YKD0_CAPAN|nr:uncharacterized protein LOC107844803 [Capsicum annuum]PHT36220.1 hypothetical protein CQW23_23920 [Capsicum baccatum]PHU05033.1 hypothetical protein BC332_25855 [Capsicum chinense]KAF3623152.1 putative serine/threonine-protein kinase-like [Capsicum annuum]KAF3624006.1 putative serine/threonine-protein kinase-like [Capsicum annuum]PHT70203.1 hypothetical protein T459_25307 [Capsicum annuum]
MAKTIMVLFFVSTLFLQGTLGSFICENLPTSVCGFAIASSGKRCLLENLTGKDGKVEYQCKTSEVVVANMKEHIETDECVDACGVDRNTVGLSSDALLDSQFTSKLCSPACNHHCPNIIDLYFNLAAGEGVYLPDLCNKQRTNPHRAMIELSSNGAVLEDAADAPAPSPVSF